MAQPSDVQRYRENRQDEIDSAAEYGAMAASESDSKIARVYSNLAKMEENSYCVLGRSIAIRRRVRRRTSSVLAQPCYRLDSSAARP